MGKHKGKKARARRKSAWRGFGVFLLVLAVLAFLALGARYFLWEPARIKTNAMSPAYYAGDTVLISKFISLDSVSRGDLVYAEFTSTGARLVRRLAGLQGDLVRVEADGEAYLDPSDGSETIPLGQAPMLTYGRIPQGAYLLLSDDLSDASALDSRTLGLVSGRSILGKPGSVIWPPNRAFK